MGEKSRKKKEKREQGQQTIPFPGAKQDIKPIPIEDIDTNELGKFVITAKDPETDEELRLCTPRSLLRLIDDLKATAEKYGPKFVDQEIGVHVWLPANKEGSAVVEMPVVKGKTDDVVEQLSKRVAPPQEIDATFQQQTAALFEVSGLKAVSYVMYTQGGGIGGAVIVNPNNSITNEEGTQLFKAMQAQAEEFKRNAEKQGFKIDDSKIILPSAGAISKFGKG